MMVNCLLYSVSVLLFFVWNDNVCAKNLLYFHYFWNCLNPFLSPLKNHRKIRQKSLHFLFLFSPFVVSLSTFFPFFSLITVVFVHFFLSYFYSSLFAFLSFFFSLFSPSFFLCLSVSLSHTSVPHVSLSLFLQRRFGVSSFCFNSFFFSLFWSWSLCFHTSSFPFFSFFISVSVFFCFKKIKKSSVVNFSRWNCLFFWTTPSSVFGLLFFPPCVVRCPLFVPCFYWFWSFLDITVLDFLLPNFFVGLFKKLSFCFWTKKFKNIIDSLEKIDFVERTLVFLILTNFCYIFFLFLFFCYFSISLKKYRVFCLNLWVSVQQNSPQKKFLILFILCFLSLLLLFLLPTFFLFSFSLSMIPLLVFALVMFIYSLSCVLLTWHATVQVKTKQSCCAYKG